MINTRAVALNGIGFGSLSVATLGFITQDIYIPEVIPIAIGLLHINNPVIDPYVPPNMNYAIWGNGSVIPILELLSEEALTINTSTIINPIDISSVSSNGFYAATTNEQTAAIIEEPPQRTVVLTKTNAANTNVIIEASNTPRPSRILPRRISPTSSVGGRFSKPL